MAIWKPVTLSAAMALLGGCAGPTLDDITPEVQEPITGTWEGSYVCGAGSQYKSVPSVARLTFESSGPDLTMVAAAIAMAQAASTEDYGYPVAPKAHDFAGSAHYTLNFRDTPPRGGTTSFSGYKDTLGKFVITQEQFINYFGGANSGNLFAPKMSGVPNPDGTMTVRLCDTTMILRKVSG